MRFKNYIKNKENIEKFKDMDIRLVQRSKPIVDELRPLFNENKELYRELKDLITRINKTLSMNYTGSRYKFDLCKEGKTPTELKLKNRNNIENIVKEWMRANEKLLFLKNEFEKQVNSLHFKE